MLNSAHIQNFRLFKDFQINDLARVNLIVGKNNVGKSSLLEALYLLANPNSPYILSSLLENRKEVNFYGSVGDNPRIYSTIMSYDISHLFFAHKLENNTMIELHSGEVSYPYRISYKQNWRQPTLNLNELDSDNLETDSYLLLEHSNSEQVKIPLKDDQIDSRIINRHFLKSSLHNTSSNYVTTKGFDYGLLAKLWNSITLTPKEDNVIEMLQIIDPNIERIAFTTQEMSNSGILIKHQHTSKPIPLGSMGDGMHRVLAIAMALVNSENGVLLIDEIDTGLHYRAMTDMWRVVMETAVRLNIQVFATTHSYDCMRSFAEALSLVEDDSVGALFRLQRRGENIESLRFDAENIIYAIEQDIEMR